MDKNIQKSKIGNVKFSLKAKIMCLSILPVLLLGLVVVIVSMTVVQDALINEVKNSLKSAAAATYAAYDQNAGSYFEAENGDVWKGGYNISKSESVVDDIRKQSDMQVTFFYGDKRVVTSAVDEDGNRILGSPAGDKVKEKVLKGGEEYFSQNVSIDGEMYYGYYIPVHQNDTKDKVVGMIFVGTAKAGKMAAIRKIIYTIVAVVVFVMAICIVLSGFIAFSISGSLKKGIQIVEEVSTGNLHTQIAKRLLARKDEIGDLSKSIELLQNKMADSIIQIKQNAGDVMVASGNLENTAKNTTDSMKEMEHVVEGIAESVTEQNVIAAKASENVSKMGHKISKTEENMKVLKVNADNMYQSEKKTVETIEKLLGSNKKVQELMEDIVMQTNQTNVSAQKIKEAVEIISSIADETSLLSLNASIEAARAGENGRGFVVVAEQIQSLALQSNESSERIEAIIHQLLEDSDRAVATMGKVTETVSNQTEHMRDTQNMTGEVMDKIQDSLAGIEIMEQDISYLASSGKELVDTVSELADIASQNAATTQEMNANTNSVMEEFKKVEESTVELKDIANHLEDSVQHFSV